MKITPLDIRRKEFKRSMRGYSDEEVDIFLDEVADEFERLFQENMELQDRTHHLDDQIAGYLQLKDALEKTLISAQLQAEELRANAHKESELILRDAELKARGIVNDSYGETQRTQQALVQLRLLEEDFRFKFRSLLEGYLRLLSQAPLASPAAEPSVPASVAPPEAPVEVPEATPATWAVPAAEQASTVAAPTSEQPQPAVELSAEVVHTTAPSAMAAVAATAEVPAAASLTSGAPVFQSVTDDTVTEEGTFSLGGPFGVPGHHGGAVQQPGDIDSTAETAALAAQSSEAQVYEAPPREVQAYEAPPREVPAYEAPLYEAPVYAPTPTAAPTPETVLVPPTGDAAPAPVDWTRDVNADEEPTRGFFFGRKLEDIDDTFPGDEVGKKGKARDFEW